MPIDIRQLSGNAVTLPDERLAELKMMTFRGSLLAPDDDGYEEARLVQNALANQRRPGLIVRCSGTADVIDAVNLARELELLTAVRAGGHSIAGYGVCEGGLMIDLSPMNGVWADPERRIVRVQGGATWGDCDREAQAFGLVVPGGVVSTTGVAGLTLGGGIGWLHRKYGLTIDSLRSVEIVTADGTLIRASETDHPDLFWALRGGGGNFGVVTSLEFDAYPLGPMVYSAAPIYGIDNADDLFRMWRDWASDVPDEITTRAVFWSMPEDEHLPPEVHNQKVLILGALYAGDPDEGERLLAPLREFGTLLADLSAHMPFRIWNSAFDAFFPKGEVASYWKSLFLPGIDEEATQLIVKNGIERGSPLTLVHVPLMGGAAARVGAADSAFGDRSARFMLSIDANWTDASDADAEIAWARGVINDAERFSSGMTYLNFSGQEETQAVALVESAFGRNLTRLREIKKIYDPRNLFRVNNNITPA